MTGSADLYGDTDTAIRFDAVTPDGERLHFDDFIYTGDVVGDAKGGYFRVGEDRGDGVALLTPLTEQEYRDFWRACNPHITDPWGAVDA